MSSFSMAVIRQKSRMIPVSAHVGRSQIAVVQGVDRQAELIGQSHHLLDLFRTARPDRHEPVRICRLGEIPCQLVRPFQYVLFTNDSGKRLFAEGTFRPRDYLAS